MSPTPSPTPACASDRISSSLVILSEAKNPHICLPRATQTQAGPTHRSEERHEWGSSSFFPIYFVFFAVNSCGGGASPPPGIPPLKRSEEHTSELQSLRHL